jgi:hypothetical protein
MTTNPTPVRARCGESGSTPVECDEIKKVRTAVVIRENAVGQMRRKIVVPITEWKPRQWALSLVGTPRWDADQRAQEAFRRRRLSGQVRLGNPLPRQAGRTDAWPAGCHRHLRRRTVIAAVPPSLPPRGRRRGQRRRPSRRDRRDRLQGGPVACADCGRAGVRGGLGPGMVGAALAPGPWVADRRVVGCSSGAKA